jgi:hypothetical protein
VLYVILVYVHLMETIPSCDTGLGWASEGSGLLKLKPDPELRARPGLGLVRLEPGLTSQKSN